MRRVWDGVERDGLVVDVNVLFKLLVRDLVVSDLGAVVSWHVARELWE